MKTLVAYSGGLDTTWVTTYLSSKGEDVTALMINSGAFGKDEIESAKDRAFQGGAKKFECIDISQDYYNKTVKYMIYGNMLKNNTYPMSVSSERIIQAIAVANYAKEHKFDKIAHGCTGAGNDQVRFEMVFDILCPEIEVQALVREQNIQRVDEIAFLKEKGIKMNFEKAKYSINKGLWGTSIGGKETLSSNLPLPEEAYPTHCTAKEDSVLTIEFEKGEISAVNGKKFTDKVAAIREVESITAPYAIGRDMHIGDTIIGIKGRVGFEAAAPMVIIKAHHALEKHVLSKWQIYWKDNISQWYGNRLHEGMILEPEMRDLEKFLESTQDKVSGKVFVQLKPYSFFINGIESEHDLMTSKFGVYGEENKAFTAQDIVGFTKVVGIQSKIWYSVNNEKY
ncbi:MAG: argininosuccinate synthase [Bacteroidales bacterium]|nr:argininosuccinate synthase [Bacteroidales bacterium]